MARNRIALEVRKPDFSAMVDVVRNAIEATAQDVLGEMDIRKRSFDRFLVDLREMRQAQADLNQKGMPVEDRLFEAESTLNCMSSESRARFKFNLSMES